MSEQDKLEFVEWLRVRDIVAGVLNEHTDLSIDQAKDAAAELITVGVIDIPYILRAAEIAETEPDEEQVPETEKATHMFITAAVPHNVAVVIVRRLGANSAIVRPVSADDEVALGTFRAQFADLVEIGDES